jgi:hypothetical protein
VYLSEMETAIFQADAGNSLALAPAAVAMDFSQPRDLADAASGGNRLGLRNFRR